MNDITSILFAAKELCDNFKAEKSESNEKKSEEFSSCLIGKEVIYLPKKKVFSAKEDIVPNLF